MRKFSNRIMKPAGILDQCKREELNIRSRRYVQSKNGVPSRLRVSTGCHLMWVCPFTEAA